jgi:hypothetical protein
MKAGEKIRQEIWILNPREEYCSNVRYFDLLRVH